MLEDPALERNRRWAWRSFYMQRRETEAAIMWAGELAEWLGRSDLPQPPACAEVVDLVRSRLSANDLTIISRYVDWHLSPPVLQSDL